MASIPQQKYNKLAGKHVLIIGGSSGIGYGVAEASLESLASVTISSSSQSRIDAAITKLRTAYPDSNIAGHPCDLSSSAMEKNIEELFRQTGKVDHIVFTAGDKLSTLPLSEYSLEMIQQAGQIRFFAPLLVAKVGRKYLSPSPASSITLTGGAVAEKPVFNWTVPASYAAGLHGMIRNLALDLKPIRVNLVSPGAVDTEFWGVMGMSEERKQGMFKAIGEKMVTGKIGRTEDVAEAYLWLMKDKNVTGFVASSDSGSKLV
ncbi:hypothetical protein BGZ60DRAFT_492302 [Tricladium varicosporioides]|nr:hypothetical protein BGZ60DRAFT_492302 [Hymenoscyphus varicosporioides]